MKRRNICGYGVALALVVTLAPAWAADVLLTPSGARAVGSLVGVAYRASGHHGVWAMVTACWNATEKHKGDAAYIAHCLATETAAALLGPNPMIDDGAEQRITGGATMAGLTPKQLQQAMQAARLREKDIRAGLAASK